jgi:hypothetical protein
MKLCGTLCQLPSAAFVAAYLSACGGQTHSEAARAASDSSGGNRSADTNLGGDDSGGLHTVNPCQVADVDLGIPIEIRDERSL